MKSNLRKSISSYNSTIQKSRKEYAGILGMIINGQKEVNHPTRNGYVYVRLRDNLSEIVLAFNEKVSPVYNFPVKIARNGSKWEVVGRDFDKYENWGTPSPYLPKHADQHSFNRDGGGGGDAVAIYPDQFMPLLCLPSGTLGSNGVKIAPYVLQTDTEFLYVGNTHTSDIVRYRPTDNQAIMGLVCINTDTGASEILIASGTPFAGTVTGTASIVAYLPYPATNQEPLYGVRLVSGTTSITWDNLYNVRQFIGGGGGGGVTDHESLTGLLGGSVNNHYHLTPSQITSLVSGTTTALHSHSGTSSSVAGGASTNVQFNTSGTFDGESTFTYDKTLNALALGEIDSTLGNSAGSLMQGANAASVANYLESFGTGVASYITFLRGRGTSTAPTAVQADDVLGRVRGRGYSGDGDYSASSVEIRLLANETHTTLENGARLEIHTTPNGSATLTKVLTVNADGNINIETGKTYNVNGAQHTHVEGNLQTSDITTNDASTSKHGFVPKAVAPASGLMNFVGITNGETGYADKPLFDTTNPSGIGTAAPGTQVIAARRDHVHAGNYQTVIGAHGIAGVIAAAGTGYLVPFISGLLTSPTSVFWPITGTLKNMYIRLSSAQPATGTLVATLMVDAAATTIVVTIPAGSAAGTYSDLVHTVAFTAGQSIRWNIVNNASGNSGGISSCTVALESPVI